MGSFGSTDIGNVVAWGSYSQRSCFPAGEEYEVGTGHDISRREQ
jgi:hypothetical protein